MVKRVTRRFCSSRPGRPRSRSPTTTTGWRATARRALASAARGPHRRHPRGRAPVRAAGGRLLRHGLAAPLSAPRDALGRPAGPRRGQSRDGLLLRQRASGRPGPRADRRAPVRPRERLGAGPAARRRGERVPRRPHWEEYGDWHLGLTEGATDGRRRATRSCTATSGASTAWAHRVPVPRADGATRRSSSPRTTSCSTWTPRAPEACGAEPRPPAQERPAWGAARGGALSPAAREERPVPARSATGGRAARRLVLRRARALEAGARAAGVTSRSRPVSTS
jgi:hypothetical protein